MIGKDLGHYRIVEKIGRGGMGEVFRARDSRLDRDVALKVLPGDAAGDPEKLARFEREAKAIAALNHPNIVTIHSVESVDGVHFLTMELVDGRTLSEIIPGAGLALEALFEIAIPLADALSSAHAKGITHRDLKPANIMRDNEGRLKVLDFGLAKLFSQTPEADDATIVKDDSVTAEGRVLGTVAYMSPEQAEGRAVDHRSDIFSLGVVLYEMTTGQRPFQGDTPISTISAILKERPPSVTELKTSLPRHLGRVVGRCMEKNPDKRFQTARDVCNELEGLEKEVQSGDIELTASSTNIAAGVTRRRGSLPWIVASVGAIAIAAATYFALSRKEAAPIAQPITTKPVTSLVGLEEAGSWSPDGGFVAYSHSLAGPMDIFVAPVGGGDPIRLVESPSDDLLPRWSPDSRWVAFMSNRERSIHVYLVPPLGGSVRDLLDTRLPTTGYLQYLSLGTTPWTHDGKSLLVAKRGDDGSVAVWRIDVDTGREEQVTHPGSGEHDGIASLSFDGADIVFLRMVGGRSKLMVMSEVGGEPRVVLEDPSQYLLPAWGPDGKSVVYTTEAGEAWVLDVSRGNKRQLMAGSSNIGSPVVSSTGRVLYNTYRHQTDIFMDDMKGGETRLTAHSFDNFGPVISPDEKSVVYMSTRTGNSELWLINLGEGDERRLTINPDYDGSPSWSPDGNRIAYFSGQGDEGGVWVMDAGGGGVKQLVSGAVIDPVRWSPDGHAIGYLLRENNTKALWAIDPAGGEPYKVLDNVTDFAWYRDSRNVVYTPAIAENEMRFRSLDSGAELVLFTEPHQEIAVTTDGKAISYCRSTSHFNMNLHVLRLDPPPSAGGLPRVTAGPVAVTHGDGEWHVHNGGWSPDGTRVLYTRDTDTGDLFVMDGAF